jgi:hypothetical protein
MFSGGLLALLEENVAWEIGGTWPRHRHRHSPSVWQIAMKRNDFPVAPIGACTRARFGATTGLCLKILCVVQQEKGPPSSPRNVLNR